MLFVIDLRPEHTRWRGVSPFEDHGIRVIYEPLDASEPLDLYWSLIVRNTACFARIFDALSSVLLDLAPVSELEHLFGRLDMPRDDIINALVTRPSAALELSSARTCVLPLGKDRSTT